MYTIVLFFTYLFFMNVVAFAIYALDKYWAGTGHWRIPEWVLIGSAVAGGAYGAGCGMSLFRHKTQHTLFLWAVPVCFVLWILLLVWLRLM